MKNLETKKIKSFLYRLYKLQILYRLYMYTFLRLQSAENSYLFYLFELLLSPLFLTIWLLAFFEKCFNILLKCIKSVWK